MRRSTMRTALMFTAPALFLIVLLRLLPFVQAAYRSLYNAPFGPLGPTEFVGLDNYRLIFETASFR